MKLTKYILTFALAVLVGSVAMAATQGDQTPRSTYGAVQVATASATAVFSSTTGLAGRNSFIIYNNGPNTIWCGSDSAVTNVTGFPVAPGSALSVDLVYRTTGDKTFYCRADTALQATPLDTRWIQVK